MRGLEVLENICDEFPILKKDWKIINEELLFAESIKDKLKRWLDLLSQDGKNTKLQVKNEIKAVLEEIKE